MRQKQIISALLFAALLFCAVPHAAIAEGEPFVCNCDALPLAVDMFKVRNMQYSPEELVRWAEHRLAHTRIPELLVVPNVMQEKHHVLQELVGERGTVVCENPIDGLEIYQVFVYAPEEVIAEIMPEILAAGIFCDCAVYHEISANDSDMPLCMPQYITIGDNLLWNPDATFGLILNEEKVLRKEYTRQELLMYIENDLAMSSMRFNGSLFVRCMTDDAQKALGELSALLGEGVELNIAFANGNRVYFNIKTEETALPQVMLTLLSEGIYVNLNEAETFPENQPYVCGDMDFDGELHSKDYMMLKRIVLKTHTPVAEQIEIADVNCDGKVNAKDCMMLKRHVLGTYKITKGKLIDMSSYWC